MLIDLDFTFPPKCLHFMHTVVVHIHPTISQSKIKLTEIYILGRQSFHESQNYGRYYHWLSSHGHLCDANQHTI